MPGHEVLLSIVGTVIERRCIAEGGIFFAIETVTPSNGDTSATGERGGVIVDIIIAAPMVATQEIRRLKSSVKFGDWCSCIGIVTDTHKPMKDRCKSRDLGNAAYILACSEMSVLEHTAITDPHKSVRLSREKTGHKYWCEVCKCGFAKRAKLQQHLAGQRHRNNVHSQDGAWSLFCSQAPRWAEGQDNTTLDVISAWHDAEIGSFPMGATRLNPSTMVGHLSPMLRGRFWRYLTDRFGQYYPEVAAILHQVDCDAPECLRLKEMFESIEAYRVISNFIASAHAAGQAVDRIFDVACGHGLVGILLGYRFPAAQVLCVDLEQRTAFAAYVAAWKIKGETEKGWDHPLDNVQFIQADLATIGAELTSTSIVVATHACNDANKLAVEMARAKGSLWAVLPCCIPNQLYLPHCSVALGDDVRYALMCGAFASAHDAQMVREIDRRITARQIVIAGGLGNHRVAESLLGLASGAVNDCCDGPHCSGHGILPL
mmetsp:Transcript_98322/g.194833  ORF Transcript_98322/g.194833 Transcript_98322/m.194833 type:complete len:488 (+) Transcript_98322:63-1526(+)